jgi:hypothetical protein
MSRAADVIGGIEKDYGQSDPSQNGTEEQQPLIEFLTPSQIKSYKPPPGTLLVGDNHMLRGGVSVAGGAPGVGKSRGTVGLAEASLRIAFR